MNKKDDIYKKKRRNISPFVFNQKTAEAFDNMAERSIPLYHDIQAMVVKLSLSFYQKNTFIYDTGCSTGNTILKLCQHNGGCLNIKAVDKSEKMLDIAKKKCAGYEIDWICKEVEEINFDRASVIIASYVLQFVASAQRKKVLKKMYQGLQPQGILLLSEKIKAPDNIIDKTFTKLYYDFKLKNKYSRLEIEQKEKALKNVLIPFTLKQYLQFLKYIGFKNINIIFRYLNFVTLAVCK